MESVTIGYDFRFNLAVKKQNGKTYKNHSVIGLGSSYSLSLWDVHSKLKKKKIEILAVNKVEVIRIAFAIAKGSWVNLSLADHLPEIPEDLNASLKYLPKFRRS